jgi:uncharacterized membrane protein YphA (DoxX/SURF4 family)
VKNPKHWLLIGRILLAGIFLAAGIAKLREPWLQFAVSINTFKIVPDSMLEPIARTLPWFEVVVGLAILSGVYLKWTSTLATLILAGFLSLLIRSWALGLEVDCGCFGSGETLGPKTIARDSLMLILSAAVTFGAFKVPRREVSSGSSVPVGAVVTLLRNMLRAR